MSTDNASRQPPSLSAADRALAEALLREAPFAYVAMVENSGPAGAGPEAAQPYVVPINFAYEPAETSNAATGDSPRYLGRLYLHTGEGRKSEALAQNPRVCVAITADAAFYQGPSPCEDGFSFQSVLAEGRVALLRDRPQREKALRAIVAKYDPHSSGLPFAEGALAETLTYSVNIETLSYRALPRRDGQ